MNISRYFNEALLRRLNEDMTMQTLAPKNQMAYIRGVNKLCENLQYLPETTKTYEDLSEFQLFMINHGVSGITVNTTLTALRFLFQMTLDKPEVVVRMLPNNLGDNCLEKHRMEPTE
jgi:integrase/recombinase XerD